MTDEPSSTGNAASTEGPWTGAFSIDGVDGGPIKLFQVGRKAFDLHSRIDFRGDTGLGDKLDEEILNDIRTLDPDGVFRTDLASVPGLARWFLGTYGAHTPAVLIHDRLIPSPPDLEGMTDQYADRYLRFMLQALGMRWLKRWVMWTAVAMRTRFANGGWRRVSVIAWLLAAIAGMTTFVIALVNGSVLWMVVAVAAPVPLAILWGKQYGAGLIAAVAAPWFLPPTVLAAGGYFVYLALEVAFGAVIGQRSGTGPYRPEGI